MLIYILCFFFSSLLLFLSNKTKKNKIIIFISLLIPCILAGLRDSSIGTDVTVYVKQIFEAATNSDNFKNYLNMGWFNSWKMVYVKDFEIGFVSLVFLIQKVFNNFQILLFFIQSLIIIPMYFGLKKFECLKNDLWLCFLIFYALFFSISLNAMRQFIGLSFVFLAFSYLINEKNIKKYLMFTLIGFIFHSSTIISLLIGIFFFINNKDINIVFSEKKKIKFKNFMLVFITLLTLFICYNLDYLSSILKLINLGQYDGYLVGSFSFSLSKILVKLPILFVFIISRKKFEKNTNYLFYLFILIFGFITSNFSSFSSYCDRIRYVFEIFLPIIIPMMINYCEKKKLLTCSFICYLFIYWYYFNVILGYNSIIPYKFFS